MTVCHNSSPLSATVCAEYENIILTYFYVAEFVGMHYTSTKHRTTHNNAVKPTLSKVSLKSPYIALRLQQFRPSVCSFVTPRFCLNAIKRAKHVHRVPKKTCDYIFYNNFNSRCPITVIFGIVSSKSMRHRMMVSFPTSPI